MRNNPTWTIDPHYWWNPFEDVTPVGSYSNYDYSKEYSLFKSEPKFVSELQPKFNRLVKNHIGFKP